MTTLFFRILALSLAMTPIILVLWLLGKCFGGRFSASCRYRVWGVVILALCLCTCLVSVPTVFTVYLPQTSETEETTPPTDDTLAITDSIDIHTKDNAIHTENSMQPPMTGTVMVPPQGNVGSYPVGDGEDLPIGNMGSIPPMENEGDTPSFPERTVDVPISVEPQQAMTETVTLAPAKNAGALSKPSAETVLFVLSHVWLSGAVLYFGIHLIGHLTQTAAYERQKKLCDPHVSSIYQALCEKQNIKRAPKLYRAANAESPMLYGFFRPTILLPDITLSQNAAVGVLAHELTHHKRGDLWQKFFCLIAVSLYWFHPLVHLASSRFHAEMELACDERVLLGMGDAARRSYGNVMLDIVKRCKHNSHSLTTRFDPHTSAVKERFMNILDMTKKKRGIPILCAVIVLCLLAGTVIGCKWETEKNGNTTDATDTTDTTEFATDSVEESTDTDTEEIGATAPLLPGDIYTAYYRQISKDQYFHLNIPDIATDNIRDVFTEDGLFSTYERENCIFADVDADGKEEAVVRATESGWPYEGYFENDTVYDLKDGKLYIVGAPSVRGGVDFTYDESTSSFLIHSYELGGVQLTYEAFLRGEEFYVSTVENAELAKEIRYSAHNVNLDKYRVNPPKDIKEGEVYTGYRVDYSFISPMYDDDTIFRFYMEIPQIYSEKEGAARLNSAIADKYFLSYSDRIRGFEKNPNEGYFKLDLTYEFGTYNGILWMSLIEQGNLLGTGGSVDTYETVYYDTEADKALSLSAALARFTEKSGELYTLPILLEKLNKALFANNLYYELLPYAINAILPVSDDSFYVIYENQPVEGTYTSAVLVTKDGIEALDGSPGNAVFHERRIRKLNAQYQGYLDGAYSMDKLLEDGTVRYEAADKINRLLAAYRSGDDVSVFFTRPDSSGGYALPDGVSVCDDVIAWDISSMHFEGAFGDKFTVNLDSEKNVKLDLYFGVGGFGDGYDIYFERCAFYTPSERLASYIPEVEAKDIVFTSYQNNEHCAYLYGVQDGEEMRLYKTKDNEVFSTVQISISEAWQNGKNELAFPSSGRIYGDYYTYGEIYVKHTDNDGVTYLVFEIDEMFENVSFFSVAEAESLLVHASNGKRVILPNNNVPRSADSVEELSLLGLAADDERDDFIYALVMGDVETLERLTSPIVAEGVYTESLKEIEIARWYAYVEVENGTIEVSFHYMTHDEDGETVRKHFYVSDGYFDRVCLINKLSSGVGSTEAGSAVYKLLANYGLCDLPTTDTMSEVVRWRLTCYICSRITKKDSYATLAEMKEFAETYFGIKDFTPCTTHMIGDLYGEVGHGGTTQSLEIVSTEQGEDGVYCVTVQFYSDPSRLAKSHLYRYYVKQHLIRYSTSIATEWEFLDCVEVTHAEFDPYIHST